MANCLKLSSVSLALTLFLVVFPARAEAQSAHTPQLNAVPSGQKLPEHSVGESARPGRSRKIAGVVFIATGLAAAATGVYIIAGQPGGRIAPEDQPSATGNILLAAGSGLAFIGTLVYRSGMNAYYKSFMPKYVTPVVSSDQVGIAWIGRF